MLWRRDLSTTDVFTGLEADPLHVRRLVLTSAQGGLALATLHDPVHDKVDIKQYRLSLGSQGEWGGVEWRRQHHAMPCQLKKTNI